MGLSFGDGGVMHGLNILMYLSDFLWYSIGRRLKQGKSNTSFGEGGVMHELNILLLRIFFSTPQAKSQIFGFNRLGGDRGLNKRNPKYLGLIVWGGGSYASIEYSTCLSDFL
eukprot:Pgem_evm1s9690